MLPSEVTRSTRSQAERRLFARLKTIELLGDPDAVGLHSLNLSEHELKRVSELDFVLISRDLILVLEVKGGRVSCDDSGTWTFTRRDGQFNRSKESPFAQARGGMYALKGRLEDHFGRHHFKAIPWGYGVVFPDIDFDVSSVEWDREQAMVVDARNFRSADGVSEALDSMAEFWMEKSRRHGPLNRFHRQQVNEIVSFMRPSFDRVPSLRVKADQIDAMQEELTLEQYDRLDAMEANERILCSGGAGSGKTFLAAEFARRQAAGGQSVILLVASPLLAAYLGSSLQGTGVQVAPFERIPDSVFDVLVVDEAQDLMNLDAMDKLDRMVTSGLMNGRWLFLYDVNKQAGLTGSFDEDALHLLGSTGAARLKLSRNCRNTEQIAIQTKLLTGGDLGVSVAGEGPPVTMVSYEAEDELVSLLDGELGRLAAQDVPQGEITILTCGDLETSAVWRTKAARKGRIKALDEQIASAWPVHSLTTASVADFKGMENRFILLIEASAVVDGENILYVGMSRARSALWVATPDELRDEIATVSEKNLPAVLNDVGAA